MQIDVPGPNILPSEICRLVLGFLKEENYLNTYKYFLKECVHLREYESLLKKGLEYPTTFMGLPLVQILNEYASMKLQTYGVNTETVQSSLLGVSALWNQLDSILTKLKLGTIPEGQKNIRQQNQSSRTRGLHRQVMGLPSRHSPLVRQQLEQCLNTVGQNTVSIPLELHSSTDQVSSNVDGLRNSDEIIEVDTLPPNTSGSGTSILSRRVGVGLPLPNNNVLIFSLGESPDTFSKHNTVGLQEASEFQGLESASVHNMPSSPVLSYSQSHTETRICDSSEYPSFYTNLYSEKTKSCSQKSSVSPAQNIFASSRTSVVAKNLQVCSPSLSSQPSHFVQMVNTHLQSPDQAGCSSVANVTATTRTSHSNSIPATPCSLMSSESSIFMTPASQPSPRKALQTAPHILLSDDEGSASVHALEVDLSRSDDQSIMQAAPKRRKKPPRRRNEVHSQSEAAGGEKPEKRLDKIINNSRFVKTLVDTINKSLNVSVPEEAVENHPVLATSNTLVSDDNYLEEFLNRDHLSMSEDTVNNFINTTRNDPIMDELFEIFNVDVTSRGSLRTPSPHANTEFQMSTVITPSLPSSTSEPAAITRSQPSAITFSTVCIDINSISEFPSSSDSDEKEAASSSKSSCTVQELSEMGSARTVESVEILKSSDHHESLESPSKKSECFSSQDTVKCQKNPTAVCLTEAARSSEVLEESENLEKGPPDKEKDKKQTHNLSMGAEVNFVSNPVISETDDRKARNICDVSVASTTQQNFEHPFSSASNGSQDLKMQESFNIIAANSQKLPVHDEHNYCHLNGIQNSGSLKEFSGDSYPETPRKCDSVTVTPEKNKWERLAATHPSEEADNEGFFDGTRYGAVVLKNMLCNSMESTVSVIDCISAGEQLSDKISHQYEAGKFPSDSQNLQSPGGFSHPSEKSQPCLADQDSDVQLPCHPDLQQASPRESHGTLSEASPRKPVAALSVASPRVPPGIISEASPSGPIGTLSEVSPREPHRTLSEASPREPHGTLLGASPREPHRTLSEASPRVPHRTLSEASPREPHRTLSEASPREPHRTLSEASPREPHGTLLEASPREPPGIISEASPRVPPGIISEASPSGPIGTLSEASPREPRGTLSEAAPREPHGIISEASPRVPPGIISEASPSGPIGTLSEASPREPRGTLSEAAPREPHGTLSEAAPREPHGTLSEAAPREPHGTLSSLPKNLAKSQLYPGNCVSSPSASHPELQLSHLRTESSCTELQSSISEAQLTSLVSGTTTLTPRAELRSSEALPCHTSVEHVASLGTVTYAVVAQSSLTGHVQTFAKPDSDSRQCPTNVQPEPSDAELQQHQQKVADGLQSVADGSESHCQLQPHMNHKSFHSFKKDSSLKLPSALVESDAFRSCSHNTSSTSKTQSVKLHKSPTKLRSFTRSAKPSIQSQPPTADSLPQASLFVQLKRALFQLPCESSQHDKNLVPENIVEQSNISCVSDGPECAKSCCHSVSTSPHHVSDSVLLKHGFIEGVERGRRIINAEFSVQTSPIRNKDTSVHSRSSLPNISRSPSDAKMSQYITSQHSTPPSLYLQSPLHSTLQKSFQSPAKSPHSSSSTASYFSPGKTRLLNEPIPEAVLEEISRHSDSCNSSYTITQSVSTSKKPQKFQSLNNSKSNLGCSASSSQDLMHSSSAPNDANTKNTSCCSSRHPLLTSQADKKPVISAKSGRFQELTDHCQLGQSSPIETGDKLKNLSADVDASQSPGSSCLTTSSSGMKMFRVVGNVDLRKSTQQQTRDSSPDLSLRQEESNSMNTLKEKNSSRQSATVFSKHETIQLMDRKSKGTSDGAGQGEECTKSHQIVCVAEGELSTSDIFISPGLSEDACKTNISMPILPIAVQQFLDNQIETGQLQFPMDLTNDLTLQKSPTTSPPKLTPIKITPVKSLKQRSPLKHLSTQIGQFAALSKGRDSHEKYESQNATKTHAKKSTPHHSRPFAAVSQLSSPKLKNTRKNKLVTEVVSVAKFQDSSAVSVTKLKSISESSDRQKVHNDFSVHSNSTTSESSSEIDSDVPLSEIVKKMSKKAAKSRSSEVSSSKNLPNPSCDFDKSPNSQNAELGILTKNVEKRKQKKTPSPILAEGDNVLAPIKTCSTVSDQKECQESCRSDRGEIISLPRVTLSKAGWKNNIPASGNGQHNDSSLSRSENMQTSITPNTCVSDPSVSVNSKAPELPRSYPIARKDLRLLQPEGRLPEKVQSEPAGEKPLGCIEFGSFKDEDTETTGESTDSSSDEDYSSSGEDSSSSEEVDVCELSDDGFSPDSFQKTSTQTTQSYKIRQAIMAAKKAKLEGQRPSPVCGNKGEKTAVHLARKQSSESHISSAETLGPSRAAERPKSKIKTQERPEAEVNKQNNHPLLVQIPAVPTETGSPSEKVKSLQSSVAVQRAAVPSADAAVHSGTGKQASKHSGTGKQAAEHSGTGKQAAEHSGTGKQAAEHSGTGKQAAEHSGIGKQAAEHSGTGKQATEHSGTGKQAAEHSSTGKQAAEHSGTGKQAAEHSGIGKQAAEHSGTGKQATEHSGTGKQATEHSDTGKQATEHSGTCKQATEHSDTGKQAAEHSGTGKQAAEHSGTGKQAAEHSGTGKQAAEHSGTGKQAAEHSGTGKQAAEHSGTGRQVAGTGWGQQNQSFRFMPVSQPQVVGIQKHGPYRRIKPILLSKNISSYFASVRSKAGAGQNMFDIGPVPSPSYSNFPASSPISSHSDLSTGAQSLQSGTFSFYQCASAQSQSSNLMACSKDGETASVCSTVTFATQGNTPSAENQVSSKTAATSKLPALTSASVSSSALSLGSVVRNTDGKSGNAGSRSGSAGSKLSAKIPPLGSSITCPALKGQDEQSLTKLPAETQSVQAGDGIVQDSVKLRDPKHSSTTRVSKARRSRVSGKHAISADANCCSEELTGACSGTASDKRVHSMNGAIKNRSRGQCLTSAPVLTTKGPNQVSGSVLVTTDSSSVGNGCKPMEKVHRQQAEDTSEGIETGLKQAVDNFETEEAVRVLMELNSSESQKKLFVHNSHKKTSSDKVRNTVNIDDRLVGSETLINAVSRSGANSRDQDKSCDFQACHLDKNSDKPMSMTGDTHQEVKSQQVAENDSKVSGKRKRSLSLGKTSHKKSKTSLLSSSDQTSQNSMGVVGLSLRSPEQGYEGKNVSEKVNGSKSSTQIDGKEKHCSVKMSKSSAKLDSEKSNVSDNANVSKGLAQTENAGKNGDGKANVSKSSAKTDSKGKKRGRANTKKYSAKTKNDKKNASDNANRKSSGKTEIDGKNVSDNANVRKRSDKTEIDGKNVSDSANVRKRSGTKDSDGKNVRKRPGKKDMKNVIDSPTERKCSGETDSEGKNVIDNTVMSKSLAHIDNETKNGSCNVTARKCSGGQFDNEENNTSGRVNMNNNLGDPCCNVTARKSSGGQFDNKEKDTSGSVNMSNNLGGPCLSMPFLGNVSISSDNPKNIQDHSCSEMFSVVHIDDSAPAQTVQEAYAGGTTVVNSRCVMNSFSSLLQQIEPTGQDINLITSGNSIEADTPDHQLPLATFLPAATATGQNIMFQESPKSCPQPKVTPVLSQSPELQLQKIMVAYLPQVDPQNEQQFGLLVVPSTLSENHLQLKKDLEKMKQMRNVYRHKTRQMDPESSGNVLSPKGTRKGGGRPKSCQPPTLSVIPQELLTTKGYRPLLPKSLQGLTNVDDRFIVMDNFTPSTNIGVSGCTSHSLTDPGQAFISCSATSSLQPLTMDSSQAEPQKKRANRSRKKVTDAQKESAVDTVKKKRASRKKKETSAATVLPDLSSPLPLVIDEAVRLSGTETSPEKRIKRKQRKVDSCNKEKKRRLADGEKNSKLSVAVPRRSHGQELTEASSAQKTPICSAPMQVGAYNPYDSFQQLSTVSPHELWSQVPQAVAGIESDHEVNLREHDTFTDMLPVKLLPLNTSRPKREGLSSALKSSSTCAVQAESYFHSTSDLVRAQTYVTPPSESGQSGAELTSLPTSTQLSHALVTSAEFTQHTLEQKTSTMYGLPVKHQELEGPRLTVAPEKQYSCVKSSRQQAQHLEHSAALPACAGDEVRAAEFQVAETLVLMADIGNAREATAAVVQPESSGTVQAKRTQHLQKAESKRLSKLNIDEFLSRVHKN